ncbi:hypothetical protein EGQ77_01130 [bacterium]|nr:hypothetical protein [bacterium]
MKKSFLIIWGILIVAGVGSAIATQNLKKGAYTCPYYQSGKKVNCMIYVDKFGIKIYSSECNNSYKNFSPEVIEKKCTVSEDKTKYYSCEYADTTCEAVFFADGKTSYVLCNGIENVPENKKNLVYDRVKVDAKSNRCRDLNPPKPVQPLQTPKPVTTTH